MVLISKKTKKVTEYLVEMLSDMPIYFEMEFVDPERNMLIINHLNEENLQGIATFRLREFYDDATSYIRIVENTDPKILKQTDNNKEKLFKNMTKEISKKVINGEVEWILTYIPTENDAELDGFGYHEYLEFFFEMCDQPWDEIKKAQKLLIKKFDNAKTLHITNSDGTDITMSIETQTFVNSTIYNNIPGSEIFSSPVKNQVNGKIVAIGRFQRGSSDIIEDITLVFKDGKIVDFDARVNKEDLEHLVTLDDNDGEGSRHLGEIGIGTNPHLSKHVLNGLLVEKIGGSFHVALGSCYTFPNDEDGNLVKVSNGNKSHNDLHWDITTLLKGKDGKMYLDGELVQDNGLWLGDEYKVLNESWGALPENERPNWWKERYPNGYIE